MTVIDSTDIINGRSYQLANLRSYATITLRDENWLIDDVLNFGPEDTFTVIDSDDQGTWVEAVINSEQVVGTISIDGWTTVRDVTFVTKTQLTPAPCFNQAHGHRSADEFTVCDVTARYWA